MTSQYPPPHAISGSELAGARVLVVDDDRQVADVVRRYLVREGALVDLAPDGETALSRADERPPDLVLLDLMLPQLHGHSVCRQLRAKGPVPVIMLTALDQPQDRVSGLELGADDYVSKPFSPQELVARVKAVLRRAGVSPSPAAVMALTAAGLELDLAGHRTYLGGQEIELTTTEYKLLVYLMRHRGQAFSREQLLGAVWGYQFGDPSTVTVHVRRLREKIEADPSVPEYVQTVRGVGYRFDPAVLDGAPGSP